MGAQIHLAGLQALLMRRFVLHAITSVMVMIFSICICQLSELLETRCFKLQRLYHHFKHNR